MAMKTVRYASMYFEDAYRRLLQLKTIWMPWHTETDPHDPINALLRLEAYRMHRDACLEDQAASERYWTTLALRASAVVQARLNGSRLLSDIPATLREVARVSSLPSAPVVLVPVGAQVGTVGGEEDPAVVFEATEEVSAASFDLEVYHDVPNQIIYVGHRSLMFDGFAFSAGTYATGGAFAIEYWDADDPVGQTSFGAWASFALFDRTVGLSKAATDSWAISAMFGDGGDHLRRWGRTTVNGIAAYWVRFRQTAAPSAEVEDPAAVIDGDWFVDFAAEQGQTVSEVIGRTTTAAWQTFALGFSPYVNGSLSALAVGTDATWTEVEDFLLCGPSDRVYVVREDVAGVVVVFGDGTNGRIPPDGMDVGVTYRFGAGEAGNVGAETVTVNRSGLPDLADFRNPHAATGWQAAEGSTPASLERIRELLPADLRALGRAVNAADYETLAVRWLREGRKPVARAYAIENGAGLRSVRLLVLAESGALVLPADLTALGTYFDGERAGTQRRGGVGLGNTTTVVANFDLTEVSGTATIRVARRFASTAKAAAEAALAAKLAPLALDSDGVSFLWTPGGEVPETHLKAAVVAAVPGFVDFVSFATTPTAPIVLGERALPTPGTWVVTVQEV